MKQPKRILCIDDDVDHLLISKLILERRGYEVLTLSDCAELLNKVITFNPGLIFMDHVMPKMMGTEATRLLKADPKCKTIPVVYFTGSDNIARLAEEAGADDWLCKPFKIDQMVDIACKYLSV